ncbi:MAG: hypothetical protein HY869_12915 [Chloroflexi bacterium]|nr:hypothetical protein [Chloroflexota bacterium]
MIETISHQNQVLCIIIRGNYLPEQTTFITLPEYKQQLGFVVYPEGGEIPRHVHRPIERRLVGTSESLIIKKGCCQLDIYNDARELVATRELHEGDIMFMVSGGHGYRMLEDTVLLEIKTGPYTGVDERERF